MGQVGSSRIVTASQLSNLLETMYQVLLLGVFGFLLLPYMLFYFFVHFFHFVSSLLLLSVSSS